LHLTVTGYGTVEFDPSRQQVLSTQIESRVVETLVQVGANIDKGEPLLRLAPSSASSLDLTQALADASAARDEFERQRRLRADGLASDADVERAQTAANDLTARANSLSSTVGAVRTVSAPSAGIVDAVLVSPGDVVAASSPLIRLPEPGAIQARINLELEDATRLAVGDPIHLAGLDGGSHVADAKISAVDLRVDPATRMTSVLVPLPAGLGFLAGEAVRASVVADTKSNVVLVPRPAVFTDEQGDYVFVDNGAVAERRRVDSGASDGALTEIISGVSPGDLVVTEGGAILSDGMKLSTDHSATASETPK
jgi:RND family efflux transporter MFP subunit